MDKYLIQHRIKTKAKCIKPFNFHSFNFKHYNFNINEGWLTDYWTAEKGIEEANWMKAINKFRMELGDLLPKISFLSQCATEFILEPFFILNLTFPDRFILIQHAKEMKTTGLHFNKEEIENLEKVENLDIDKNFFIFMMESTNANTGSARLIMLFSAIENLAQTTRKVACTKCKHERYINGADPVILKEILGNELYDQCWGTGGFRHKMSHGTFPKIDGKLIEKIYKKIVEHINKKYGLSINEEVVDPQRSFSGSGEMGRNFYKYKSTLKVGDMDLKFFNEILDKNLHGDKDMIEFVPFNDSLTLY